MLKNLHWPAAVVLCVAILSLALTAVLGPKMGLDQETLRMVLGGEGTIGVAVAALMRPMLGGK